MSTTHVLVKWDSNWADEMDVEGFIIMERKAWNEFKANARKITHPFSICVGTNEEIDYETGKDLLDELTGKDITPEEKSTIKKFFGESGGFTSFLNLPEEEEEIFDVNEDSLLDDYYEQD